MREPDLASAGAANDFLAVLLADLEAGRLRTLADYQRQFPAHAEAVAAELAALTASPAAASLPAIPQVVLEAEIGRGGQGTVYRGRQDYLDRPVAVKVLSPAFRHPQFVDRFRREARTLAGLVHPNIVTCHQGGVTADGSCYLVMELIDGPSLRAWLDAHGPLSTAAALRLARDLTSALAHAHGRGIVHRDVKPENVLLEPCPAAADPAFPWRPRLADLGLARPLHVRSGATMATPSGVWIGTPATMAPEQFDAPESVDHRADIYGLGCVLHHALTGSPAFRYERMTELLVSKSAELGPDLRALAPDLPDGVAALVRRMLAHAPEQRPADYGELLTELDRLAGPSEAPVRARRGNRRSLAWAAAALVLGAVGLGAFAQGRLAAPGSTARAAEQGGAPAVLAAGIELFAPGLEPFREWGWVGPPGFPGRHEESGEPSLSSNRGLAVARRALPPGRFELQGALEVPGRHSADGPRPVRRAGLRIAFGQRLALELLLTPSPAGEGYDAALAWIERGSAGGDEGDWRMCEAVATAAGALRTVSGELPLALGWQEGELACTLGPAGALLCEERTRPPEGVPDIPTELQVFVEGGLLVLHRFALRP